MRDIRAYEMYISDVWVYYNGDISEEWRVKSEKWKVKREKGKEVVKMLSCWGVVDD